MPAVLVHPPRRSGAAGTSTAIPHEAPMAMIAMNVEYDFDRNHACFYCGDVTIGLPCFVCGQDLCDGCTKRVGCACMLADDKKVVLNSFVPDPGRDKTGTMNKSQKKVLKTGYVAMKKQDDAM